MSVAAVSPIVTCYMTTAVIGSLVPQKGRAMEKGLIYGSLGVAALMLLVFLLDIAVGIFGGGSPNPFTTVDVFGIIAAGVVGYLAFNASKDLK